MNSMSCLMPMGLVLISAIVVLVMDLFRPSSVKGARHLAWLAFAASAGAVALAASLWPGQPGPAPIPWLANGLRLDAFSLFGQAVLASMTGIALLISHGFDQENDLDHGEYYSFYLFALLGMMVLVSSTHLLVMLIGLETMSLAVYGLVAFRRSSARSAEAGFKYFVMGGVASAFFIFGMAVAWGETGSFELQALAAPVVTGGNFLLVAALGMLLVAFCFKVAVVPFHLWTPDAYEGAPTPVTGFMASAVKTAGFMVLARVVFLSATPEAFSGMPFNFVDLVLGVAVLTMTTGNLAALWQRDIKRMLAYSSIAHAGYMLSAFALVPTLGSGVVELQELNGALLFYLVGYGTASLVAFGVLSQLATDGNEDTRLERLAGLGTRRPALALLMVVALVSLAGIPVSAGFFGKFYLFKELIIQSKGRLIVLVVIAVLNSLIGVAYYLRPMIYMYMKDSQYEHREVRSASALLALILAALATLGFGLLPNSLTRLSQTAARDVQYGELKHLDPDLGQLAPLAEQLNGTAVPAAEKAAGQK